MNPPYLDAKFNALIQLIPEVFEAVPQWDATVGATGIDPDTVWEHR